jgi:hypothetical protein
MKTKIKFLLVSFTITAIAITGFHFVQNGSNVDVSLADIVVRVKADGESSSNNRGPMCYDSNWKAGCKLLQGYCSTAAKADC